MHTLGILRVSDHTQKALYIYEICVLGINIPPVLHLLALQIYKLKLINPF